MGAPLGPATLADDPRGTGPGSYHEAAAAAPSSTPAGTPLGQVKCEGFSGIAQYNPRDQVMQDTMGFPSFAPVKVGDGTGRINWTSDPYHNPSWTLWLLDLKWIGSLIGAYTTAGDQAALDHAVAITQSYIADNPPAGWIKNESAEGRAHRSEVLICLALAMGTPPQWLVDSLDTHAQYLEANYSGYSNHGVDEDLALLDIGCLLGRQQYADYAADRLDDTVAHLVDSQGVPIEQSTGYASYDYQRLMEAERRLTSCGEPVPSQMQANTALIPEFLAQSTMPDGNVPQIGDVAVQPQAVLPGTIAEYPATKGASGTPPTARHRTYTGGYAFGRSTWTPFTSASWYSLHFGPPKILHGHLDHTSLLYYARGRRVLTDGGFYGYVNNAQSAYTKSTEANNVLTVAGLPYSNVATSLVASAFTAKSDYYQLADTPATGIRRYRSVLISRGPDLAVVMDRITSTQSRTYRQLWHLLPGESVVVSGRATAASVPADHSRRLYLMQVLFAGQSLPAGSTSYVRGQTTPTLQGWVSEQPYSWVAAPTVQMSRVGTSAVYLTLVVPTRYNAKMAITSFVRGKDGYYTMGLNIDGQTAVLRLSGGGYLSRVR